MTRLRWMLAAFVTCAAWPALAADHLVAPLEADLRLEAAARTRATDRASLDRFLGSPAAQQGVRTLGQDPAALAQALDVLSDTELRDLAARAEALDLDPVAGLSADVNQLLIIFLIVAIVILVLQAVD